MNKKQQQPKEETIRGEVLGSWDIEAQKDSLNFWNLFLFCLQHGFLELFCSLLSYYLKLLQ